MAVVHDTKLAILLRNDLASWQKRNVAASTVSGVAATLPDVTGERYRDASGQSDLPMFRQPVLVFEADAGKMKAVCEHAGTVTA